MAAFTAGDLLAFGFTEGLVDRIMRFLDTSATDLDGSKPDQVGHTAFGVGPASTGCSTDAGKAREHVVEAITDIVTGLHTFHSSLGGMKRLADEADQSAEDDIQRLILRATDCTAPPTVGSPSQCTPLPAGGGGDR